MSTVVVLTKGTDGDVLPFLAAGLTLRNRGHRVVVTSNFAYKERAERAGLEFIPLDNPEECQLFLKDTILLNTGSGSVQFFERHCLPRIPRELEILSAISQRGPILLLARHMATIADLLMAEKYCTPLIRVFTSVSQVNTLDLLSRLMGAFFTGPINALRSGFGLPPLSDWMHFLALPSANVGIWPSWFATPNKDSPVAVNPIGFLIGDSTETNTLPADVNDFVVNGSTPVLITGGTGEFPGQQFYSSALNACELLNLRALVVTRHRYLVPRVLKKDAKWVASLPFASLMRSTSVVIHHGGIGTIARAMVSGIPQLILALGADRPDNASHIERLGAGYHLRPPQWDPRIVSEFLGDLLNSTSVRTQCLFLSSRLENENAAECLCDLVESLV